MVLALVALALAAPQADYRAPAACPDERAFWSEVQARSLRVGSSTGAPAVRVVITATAASYAGWVAVDDAPARTLEGSSCADLVRGLALVTALLLDAEPRATPAPKAAPPARRAPAARPPRRAAPPRRPEGPRGMEVGFGVDAAVSTGAVPGVALGVPIFAELHWEGGPSLRLAFRRAVEQSDRLPVGEASFSWSVGRFDVCPLDWEVALGTLTACAVVEGGLMEADPERIPGLTASREGWAGVGVGVRLWSLVMGPFFVEGTAVAVVPFLRQRYYFAPDLEIFTTAPVVVDVGVGAGVRFW